MIRFIRHYFREAHVHREYYMTRAERRKAWLMALGILFCIAILLLIWLR